MIYKLNIDTSRIAKVHLQMFLLFCVVKTGLLAQSGTIGSFPQELTVHAGESFEVTWWVNPGDGPVAAIDFVLWYDSLTIEPLAIEKVNSPLNINPFKPLIDREQGRIVYAAFKLNKPWPSEPFPLMTIRLQALDTVGVSTLYHDPNIAPNTSMAFEGRSTLEKAHDLRVTILSNEQLISEPIPGLNMPLISLNEETGFYTYYSKSESAGNLRISAKNQDDTFPEIFWETRVNPGHDFHCVLNPEVIPQGVYILNMQSADDLKVEKEVSF